MLQKLSFTEKGVMKTMLTPNLVKYVDISIKAVDKGKYMEIIASYYINILKAFYFLNAGDTDRHVRKTES